MVNTRANIMSEGTRKEASWMEEETSQTLLLGAHLTNDNKAIGSAARGKEMEIEST